MIAKATCTPQVHKGLGPSICAESAIIETRPRVYHGNRLRIVQGHSEAHVAIVVFLLSLSA